METGLITDLIGIAGGTALVVDTINFLEVLGILDEILLQVLEYC